MREVAETVVFVVILVLMLKMFVAEAFVIPTGSMAETLFGYHKMVTCEKCRQTFPLNCSTEVEHEGVPIPVLDCQCPNCKHQIHLPPYKPPEFGERIAAYVGGFIAGFIPVWGAIWLWGKRGPNHQVPKQSHTFASCFAGVVVAVLANMLFLSPPWNSGDRVLVAKYQYDSDHLWKPKRHEVIVFKFPGNSENTELVRDGPQKGSSALNYIKRCEGLEYETVAIFNGDLYVTKSLKYPLPTGREEDYWHRSNMHVNDEAAVTLFRESLERAVAGKPAPGDFEIVRKPADMMLDVRRIVFDNDHQPADLADKPDLKRWKPAGGTHWSEAPNAPTTFVLAGTTDDAFDQWLEYGHRLRPAARPLMLSNPAGPFEDDPRRLIDNSMGYNSAHVDAHALQWVGDLMLDCTVKVTSAQGEFVLELAKAGDRFQARFNLASGDCTLMRVGEKAAKPIELKHESTKMKGTGTYHVRFANFDNRLTVWVDGRLPFGDGVPYDPSGDPGPVVPNDLQPARLGGQKAGVEVSHLQLWRDGCYTVYGGTEIEGTKHRVQTMYVQPGHYLALGDNSSASSDSRYWGLVPQRLLLGRALMVYFPFWPFSDPTRFGWID
jgi:signal peptidase I